MVAGDRVDRAAHMAVADFEDDIYASLKDEEAAKAPSVRLINSQPEISWSMRPQLLEFLMQAQQMLDLSRQTFLLSVSILDRYASKRVIFCRHYQLVGCVSLWLAAKLSDDKRRVPTVADLSYLCAGTFSEATFCEMEFHILASLDWNVLMPTTADFVDYNIALTARKTSGSGVYTGNDFAVSSAMAAYICECALFNKTTAVVLPPSVVAASAVALALVIVDALGSHNRPFLCPEDCTKECFDALAAVISTPPSVAVVSRFSTPERWNVAAGVAQFFRYCPAPGMVTIRRSPSLLSVPEWGMDSPTSSASMSSDSPSSIHMPRTPEDQLWSVVDNRQKTESGVGIPYVLN